MLGSLWIERAEFSEKPVQSLGCPLVDVAVASAGIGLHREVLHFRFKPLRESRQVIRPVLQLILPYPNKFRGRIPVRLRAYLGPGNPTSTSRWP